MPVDIANACNCGKAKNEIHCPNCGRVNFYAVKQTLTRIHPLTGQPVENVKMFRCRRCGDCFDDLQWQYECKAPVSEKLEQLRKHEDTKQTLIEEAKAGDKFDDNKKRHFQKIVGMNYDLFMRQLKQALQYSESKRRAEEATKMLINSTPTAPPTMKSEKLTPLQYHIENCNECMANDELCSIGKNLEIAERMPQP